MSLDEQFERHFDKVPQLDAAAFIAPSADILGDVCVGEDASIFYGCVLRADINSIEIGAGTNVQDGTIVHLADEHGVRIGAWTTVGHGAVIHACTIGDECLIGMRATVLDGAEIGSQSIVGAGSLVTKGLVVPPGSLVMGVPAKVVRPLSTEERGALRGWAEKYVKVARRHAARWGTGAGS